MERAFFFNATAPCEVTSHDIDARCIYFDDRREITELEFFNELEKALKTTDSLPVTGHPTACYRREVKSYKSERSGCWAKHSFQRRGVNCSTWDAG